MSNEDFIYQVKDLKCGTLRRHFFDRKLEIGEKVSYYTYINGRERIVNAVVVRHLTPEENIKLAEKQYRCKLE